MVLIFAPAENMKYEDEAHTQITAIINGERISGIMDGSSEWKNIQAALDAGAEIAAYPVPAAEELGAQLITAIDALTEKRITGGFAWNSKTLSSSKAAQMNIENVDRLLEKGMASFPIPWSEKDGTGFTIDTQDDWNSLYQAKAVHVFMTEKQAGQALRDQVAELVETDDIDALNAWKDPRIETGE